VAAGGERLAGLSQTHVHDALSLANILQELRGGINRGINKEEWGLIGQEINCIDSFNTNMLRCFPT